MDLIVNSLMKGGTMKSAFANECFAFLLATSCFIAGIATANERAHPVQEYIMICDAISSSGGRVGDASNQLVFTLGESSVGGSSSGDGYMLRSGLSFPFMISTDVIDEPIVLTTALHLPFPNPFNPKTRIRYDIAEDAVAELAVFDVQGRKVKTLASGRHWPGSYEVQWNGQNAQGVSVSSGVYFSCLRIDDELQIQRLVLLK
jgi:hypothetical protein